MKKLLSSVDFFDVIAFLGFAGLSIGIGMVSIKVMFIVVGILLMVFGLFGAGFFAVKSK